MENKTNKVKTNNFLSNELELVNEGLGKDESFASITLNPIVNWMKFVLTDDRPNGNKQRIPEDEFKNLISTGVYMPIKMAFGEMNEGHDDSFPIGVITHLKQVKNRIEGLAALWSREREEDINYLKERFEDDKVPQISWEIPFTDSTTTEDGIEELHGITLRAATIVGIPAYAGRTPIVAIASKDDKNGGQKSMEELETVKQELKDSKDEIKELKTAIAEKEVSLKEKTEKFDERESELVELKEFKASVEAEKEKGEKLDGIKAKFAEADITKEEDYFEKNEELLLGFDDNSLDFFVQELVAFAADSDDGEEGGEGKASKKKVPNIPASDTDLDLSEVAEMLRKRHKK